MFYSCPLELREFQLNEDARLHKLKYWHKMTMTGNQFLVLFRVRILRFFSTDMSLLPYENELQLTYIIWVVVPMSKL